VDSGRGGCRDPADGAGDYAGFERVVGEVVCEGKNGISSRYGMGDVKRTYVRFLLVCRTF